MVSLSLKKGSQKLCIDTEDVANAPLLVGTVASQTPSPGYPHQVPDTYLVPEDLVDLTKKLDFHPNLADPKQLAEAYELFAGRPELKTQALDSFQMMYGRLHNAYWFTKARLQGKEAVPKGPLKPWAAQAPRVIKGGMSAHSVEAYAAQAPNALDAELGWIRLRPGPRWMDAMVQLILLRKMLNARFAKQQLKPLQHLTVLQFDEGFSTLVFNAQSTGGGTTRMLLPVSRREAEVVKLRRGPTPILRVLDMSYRDVWTLIKVILLPRFEDDRDLATTMLDALAGDRVEAALYNRTLNGLGHWNCSFIYGAELKGDTLTLRDGWGLSKKSKKAADLNTKTVGVTVYEAICYVLTILFLAEPRHSLGMWHATLLSLHLVAEGHLTFAHLFSSPGGHIRYGRLLPGANVLKGALEYERKRLAMPLVDSVQRQPDAQDLPNFQELIDFGFKPKVTYGPFEHVHEPSAQHVFDNAVYQPLLKVLFIEFLYLLTLRKKDLSFPFEADPDKAIEVVDHIDGEANDDELRDLSEL